MNSSPGHRRCCGHIVHHRSVIWLALAVTPGVLALTVIVPIIPLILLDINSDVSESSKLNGYALFLGSFFSLALSILAGYAADRFSRRKVLAAIFAYEFIPTLLLLLCTWQKEVVVYMLARIVGSGLTPFRVAFTYAADIATSSEQQTKNFSVLEGIFGISLAFGPAIGGIAGGFLGLPAALYTSMGFRLLAVFFTWFLLVDTNRIATRQKHASSDTFGTRIAALKVAWNRVLMLIRERGILVCLIISLMNFLADQDVQDVGILFLAFRFPDMPLWQQGLLFGFFGLFSLVFQVVGARILINRVPLRWHWILSAMALLLGGIGHLVFGASFNVIMLFAAAPLLAVPRLSNAVVSSALSDLAPPDSKGFALGINGGMQPVAIILGSLTVTQLFGEFSDVNKNYHWILSGAPYFLGSALYFIDSAIAFTAFKGTWQRVLEKRADRARVDADGDGLAAEHDFSGAQSDKDDEMQLLNEPLAGTSNSGDTPDLDEL